MRRPYRVSEPARFGVFSKCLDRLRASGERSTPLDLGDRAARVELRARDSSLDRVRANGLQRAERGTEIPLTVHTGRGNHHRRASQHVLRTLDQRLCALDLTDGLGSSSLRQHRQRNHSASHGFVVWS
jgi:hypothetical protein